LGYQHRKPIFSGLDQQIENERITGSFERASSRNLLLNERLAVSQVLCKFENIQSLLFFNGLENHRPWDC